MMNLNDLRVEQEIAQERYEQLIRIREVGRLLGPRPSLFQEILLTLGRKLVVWGHTLQMRFAPLPCCV